MTKLDRVSVTVVGAALRAAEKEGVALEDVRAASLDGVSADPKEARAAAERAHQAASARATYDEWQASEKAKLQGYHGPMRTLAGQVGRGLSTHVVEPLGRFIDTQLTPEQRELWDGARSTIREQRDALVARANRTMSGSPEDVVRSGVVELQLRSGRTMKVPVRIPRQAATRSLLGLSLAFNAVGAFLPIVGHVIQGGLGVACGFASRYFERNGSPALAKSLDGMREKHVCLGLIGVVPGPNPLAAVASARDAWRLMEGVPLEDLVPPRHESPQGHTSAPPVTST